MATFWGRIMAGLRAAKEAWLNSNDPVWAEWDARRFRYELLWSYYASNTYREQVHKWARALKSQRALYKYIRNIYNPMYRLGEFWATHLWGGMLDPAAGNGDAVPSALPIIIDDERADEKALRAAIAELWKWSNWQTQKDIVTLQGAIKGDVALRVVDDTARERVYVEIILPDIIKWVELDPFNNVKGYCLEERILDTKGREVTRREEVVRGDGETVLFATFKDDKPFGFDGQPAVIEANLGFVPFVTIQHNNVGADWGWGEGQPQLSKLMEVDDQASLLSDQIRKLVNVVWFASGVKKQDKIELTSTQDDTIGSDGKTRTQAGREDDPMITASNPDAKMTALVADLKIGEVSKRTLTLLEAIEEDYPELTFEKLRRRGEASGMALRVARQPAETKVRKRRPTYDAALVHAHQMAIAIGGAQGYDGYEGFSLESFAAGALNHTIGDRPVFDPDELELAEVELAHWKAAAAAVTATAPLSWYLRRQKIKPVTEEDLTELEASPEMATRRAAGQLAALGMIGLEGEEEG